MVSEIYSNSITLNDIKDRIIFEFCDDIALRKSELQNSNVTSDDRKIDGSMVIPLPFNGFYYILINQNLKNDINILETIAHELSHLEDYYIFSQKYCSGDYSLITSNERWLPFYFYSEYKAKKSGYNALYNALYSKPHNENIKAYEIMLDEIYENRYNDLIKNFEIAVKRIGNNENVLSNLYDIFRYLGIFESWTNLSVGKIKAYEAICKVLNVEFISLIDLSNNMNSDIVDLILLKKQIYQVLNVSLE